MRSTFALLVRHFFERFFDNDIVSRGSDMRTNMVQALGLVAAPGMLVSLYMLPQRVRFDRPLANGWLLIGDYYFFVLYSMVVMGLVMVFEWDSLFPDRKDYLILTPLPLGGPAIFTAKLAALIVFLTVFVVDANFLCTVIAPPATGPPGTPGTPVTIVWRLAGAHAIAVAAAGAFVALACAGLQGVLINLLTARAFRRVSPWVQMGLMGLLITVLFLTPLATASIPPLVEANSPLLRWFPPFWFLALYVDLLPGRPAGPVFHQLAPLARQALAVSAAVFAAGYFAGYRRHTRRVMEGLETAGTGPGPLRRTFHRMVNRWLVPHPLERATFHFIGNTILRTAKHRLLLAAYGGIALALGLCDIVRFAARPGVPAVAFVPEGLLVLPLTLSFFTVTGLRAAFNFPAELRANWIFQVSESEERVRHIRAVRKWIVVMGILPLFAMLAPFEAVFRGWKPGLIHLGFALLLSLVLLEILLVWFRKIPFTCSYFPGKTSMAVAFFVYLAGFTTYSWSMAGLEEALLRAPLKLIFFFAAGALALVGLARLEKRELSVDDVLIYEDEPDPVVRSLELG
jgi:hypothetical protein